VFGASALPDSFSYLYTPGKHGNNHVQLLDATLLKISANTLHKVHINSLTVVEKGI